jgi:hypothetical protein
MSESLHKVAPFPADKQTWSALKLGRCHVSLHPQSMNPPGADHSYKLMGLIHSLGSAVCSDRCTPPHTDFCLRKQRRHLPCHARCWPCCGRAIFACRMHQSETSLHFLHCLVWGPASVPFHTLTMHTTTYHILNDLPGNTACKRNQQYILKQYSQLPGITGCNVLLLPVATAKETGID